MATSAEASLVLQVLKQPLQKQDLGFLEEDLTGQHVQFVNKFESAWSDFLDARPDLVPRKEERRLQALQAKLQQAQQNQATVQAELQKQLAFFQSSRETLESLLARKKQEALEKQRELHAELQAKLDTIAMADHLLSKTLPWQSFLKRLDQKLAASKGVVEEDQDAAAPEQQHRQHVAKPSQRAMALVDPGSGSDVADIQLRAHRIDHALLSTNIQVLQTEVERLEKTMQAQEGAGHFLTEHNVWSLLGNNEGQQKSVTTGGQSTTVTGSLTRKTAKTDSKQQLQETNTVG